MDKSFKILKYIFHSLNFIMIALYLYPGSILGWVVYRDLKLQPQITRDLSYFSTNHFYAFFLLSILGLFCYIKHSKFKFLIYYLFFLSIVLELFHILIPARSGSKRVKNKNMKFLKRTPLLGRKIKSCLKSKIGNIVVSTDSKKIAKCAKKLGAKVPFLRSKK